MVPPLSVRLRKDHFGNSRQVSAPLHVMCLPREATLPLLPWYSGASAVADLAGHSGPQVDFHQSPNRMHAVEDPQRQAEVDNGEPGPVAVKILFQPVFKLRVYAKRGHHPQLGRERRLLCEGGALPNLKMLSSCEADLDPAIGPAFILGFSEQGPQP